MFGKKIYFQFRKIYDYFLNKKNKNVKSSKKKHIILFFAKEISMDDKSKITINFINNIIKNNIDVVILSNFVKTRIQFNSNVKIIERKINFFTIRHICKKYKIDAICTYDEYLLKFIKILKLTMDIKSIYIAFDVPQLKTNYIFFLFKKSIKCVDLIFYTSGYIRDYYLDKFSIEIEKMHNFDFCIDYDFFDEKKIKIGRIKKIFKEIDTDINEKKIFYCQYDCRNVMFYDKILKAISKIKRDDFVFIFSGKINKNLSSIDEIIKIIKKYNISSCVKFIDEIEDKPAMLSICYAVLCIQQLYDYSLTNTIRESECIGKPLIVITENNYLPDMIEDKIGFYANNCADQIFSVITNMLNLTESEYSKMQERAIMYAKKYFIDEKAYKSAISNIKKLINN